MNCETEPPVKNSDTVSCEAEPPVRIKTEPVTESDSAYYDVKVIFEPSTKNVGTCTEREVCDELDTGHSEISSTSTSPEVSCTDIKREPVTEHTELSYTATGVSTTVKKEKPKFTCSQCPVDSEQPCPHKRCIAEKKFSCPQCLSTFTRARSMRNHMRIHTGEKPFTCSYCPAAYAQSGSLRQHMKIHTEGKPHVCPHCSAAFSRVTYLRDHMRKHTGERPFTCTLCSAAFSQSRLLRQHMRTHTGEKPYKCPYCSLSFRNSGHLKNHIGNRHTGEKPHKCPHCPKAYMQANHLRGHIRSHTGEKPFKCSQCPSAFTTRHSLKEHVRSHTGEMPYTCPQCQRNFMRSVSLTRHLRTHGKEKRLLCLLCEAVFKYSKDLKIHMKTHKGEMPNSAARRLKVRIKTSQKEKSRSAVQHSSDSAKMSSSMPRIQTEVKMGPLMSVTNCKHSDSEEDNEALPVHFDPSSPTAPSTQAGGKCSGAEWVQIKCEPNTEQTNMSHTPSDMPVTPKMRVYPTGLFVNHHTTERTEAASEIDTVEQQI